MSFLLETGRKELTRLLPMCTIGEIEVFGKMYGTINDVKKEQMEWAISQVQRTLDKRGVKY